MPPSSFRISRSTPACYFTAVTHDRLPVFRTDLLKQVLCGAWAEARQNHGILILAYVIMLDHAHVLAYSTRAMSDVLRLMNGVAARRIIQFLKENDFQSSLFKLRGATRERNHKHSVWHHHTDSLEIFGEDTFRQKVEYIHQNPVRAGLCARSEEYRFSSARQWDGKELNDEPLMTDHRSINWR
jgi:putative transposase